MEMSCGLCHSPLSYRAQVCASCRGTVAYGVSGPEVRICGSLGLVAGLVFLHQGSPFLGLQLGFDGYLMSAVLGAVAGGCLITYLRRNAVRCFRNPEDVR